MKMQFLCYIVSSTALLLIMVTMLARANDLRWKKGAHWNTRLFGFIIAGFTPFGIIGYEYFASDWPNFYEMCFRVGITLVFLTTPQLPPWWKWISGQETNEPRHADDRREPK